MGSSSTVKPLYDDRHQAFQAENKVSTDYFENFHSSKSSQKDLQKTRESQLVRAAVKMHQAIQQIALTSWMLLVGLVHFTLTFLIFRQIHLQLLCLLFSGGTSVVYSLLFTLSWKWLTMHHATHEHTDHTDMSPVPSHTWQQTHWGPICNWKITHLKSQSQEENDWLWPFEPAFLLRSPWVWCTLPRAWSCPGRWRVQHLWMAKPSGMSGRPSLCPLLWQHAEVFSPRGNTPLLSSQARSSAKHSVSLHLGKIYYK